MIKKQSDEGEKNKNLISESFAPLQIDVSKSVFKTPKKQPSQQDQDNDTPDKKQKFCMSQLCASFVQKYNRSQKPQFFAKDLMDEFNVKQRRIYDLMNIMEGLGCVRKISKGKYQWEGINKTDFDIVEARKGQANSLRYVAARIKLIIAESKFPLGFSEIYDALFAQESKKRQINPLSLRRRIYECCKVLRILGYIRIRKIDRKYEWIQGDEVAKPDYPQRKYRPIMRKARRVGMTEEQLIQQIVRKYKTEDELENFLVKIKRNYADNMNTTIKKDPEPEEERE